MEYARTTRLRVLPLLCLLTVATIRVENSAAAPAGFTDALDGKFDASEYLMENAFGFLPVPVIITEPAVDGGLGITGLFFNENQESAAQRRELMRNTDTPGRYLLPPNVTAVAAAYTGNGSWFLGGGHMGFFNNGDLRYSVGGGYADFKLDYYSLGGVELPRPVSINTKSYGIRQMLKFRISDTPWFIGPMQRFSQAEMSPGGSQDEILPPGVPPELGDAIFDRLTSDTTLSALGAVAEYDSRDNIFTPKTGLHYTLEYLGYRDAIGSDIDYDWYHLTGLNYFRLNPSWRVGVRLDAEIADSDDQLPPFAMPGLDLRGVPTARYQGPYAGLVEGELTWELDMRWSLLGFLGAGRTANSSSEFGSASSVVTKGVGFRYLIARLYSFNMGIDIARGPEDTVFYIQAGSAW